MKLKFSFTIAFLTLCFSQKLVGQSIMLYNNGKSKQAYILSVDYFHVYYSKSIKKNGNKLEIAQKEKNLKLEFDQLSAGILAETEKKISHIKNSHLETQKVENKVLNLQLKKSKDLDKINRRYVKKLADLKYDGFKRVRRDHIFSLMHRDGSEEVLYSPDTLSLLDSSKVDVDFNVEEMRRFIKGEQDGRIAKSPLTTLISTGIGTASGMFGFFGPIIPSVYFGIIALKKKNPALERQIPNEGLRDDAAYTDGFNRTAKRKKLKNAALGSTAGLALGITTFLLFFRIL